VTAQSRRQIAVLGGGMAGLTAAWALSAPECRDRFDVTVFERQWNLGGKGASTRGVHQRIEEHGLHVWLGYYDNAFRLMREVYDELDRPRRQPDSPIATWRDAFLPAGRVGVQDRADWSHWVASFSPNDIEPGAEGGPAGAFSFPMLLQRGLRLLLDFSASLEEPLEPASAVVISASGPPRRSRPPVAELMRVVRQAEITGIVAAVESLQAVRDTVPGLATLTPSLLGFLERTREELLARVRRDSDARRSWQLADMVIASLRGSLRDGLVAGPHALASIDHLDFREWLALHGASPETLDSPLLSGMYDLVFAYEDGDHDRPRFSAGLGLFLATKLFFDYKGAIFWKLRAGMGDVIFAPLYEALRDRGVRFQFAHGVDRLHVDDGRIAAITVSADPQGGDCDPLVRVKGLTCFPERDDPEPAERLRLLAGVDFDAAILATPLATAPTICAELIADSRAWREMTDRVATVGTQSFQLWMRADERALGWEHGDATVSGYVTPFDTYASMSHVLDAEDWPSDDPPRAVGYFCSVLPSAVPDALAPAAVDANVGAFLEGPIERFWPGFDPDLVVSCYSRANVEPSDRYVQSLPGTGRWRLPADGSGYDNLFLAGDWIDSGLNAGCIEAAVLSGLEAANAVRGRDLMDGVLGTWCELGRTA
jgi:uncharacterized protein with NAD-binding domain and iron-sulfur cluster